MRSRQLPHHRLRRPALQEALIVGLLAALACSGHAAAASFCDRVPFDAEFPAGLTGEYDAVGRHGVGNVLYSARITVSVGDDAYAVRRTETSGLVSKGEAWITRCGTDKITALMVQYENEENLCALGNDGDNYYRITCLTRAREGAPEGVEAWFQKH